MKCWLLHTRPGGVRPARFGKTQIRQISVRLGDKSLLENGPGGGEGVFPGGVGQAYTVHCCIFAAKSFAERRKKGLRGLPGRIAVADDQRLAEVCDPGGEAGVRARQF
jgi:hypothetical protein